MSERECSEILVYGNIKTAIFPEAGALNDATHEQWLAPTCPAFPFRPRRALAPGDDAALACVCWGWGRGDRPVVGVRRREAIIGDRPPRRTSSSATRGSWPARDRDDRAHQERRGGGGGVPGWASRAAWHMARLAACTGVLERRLRCHGTPRWGVGDCVLSRFALNYWFPYASLRRHAGGPRAQLPEKSAPAEGVLGTRRPFFLASPPAKCRARQGLVVASRA